MMKKFIASIVIMFMAISFASALAYQPGLGIKDSSKEAPNLNGFGDYTEKPIDGSREAPNTDAPEMPKRPGNVPNADSTENTPNIDSPEKTPKIDGFENGPIDSDRVNKPILTNTHEVVPPQDPNNGGGGKGHGTSGSGSGSSSDDSDGFEDISSDLPGEDNTTNQGLLSRITGAVVGAIGTPAGAGATIFVVLVIGAAAGVGIRRKMAPKASAA